MMGSVWSHLNLRRSANPGHQYAPRTAMDKRSELTHVIRESSEPFPCQPFVEDTSDEPPRKRVAANDRVVYCDQCDKPKNEEKCSFLEPQSITTNSESPLSLITTTSPTADDEDDEESNVVDKHLTSSKSFEESNWTELDMIDDENNISEILQSSAAASENGDIADWTVLDVFDFVQTIPGCSGCAQDFIYHEIDGRALLLIDVKCLFEAMDIRLGPALKIVDKVKSIKEANRL